MSGWTTIRVAGDADLFYANFSVKRVISEGVLVVVLLILLLGHFIGPRICGAGHYISSTGGGGDFNYISPDVCYQSDLSIEISTTPFIFPTYDLQIESSADFVAKALLLSRWSDCRRTGGDEKGSERGN